MGVVKVRLIGGLGNQMFQYAAARALSLRSGANIELDLSWFGSDPQRTYALAPYGLNVTISQEHAHESSHLRLPMRIMNRVSDILAGSSVKIFKECSFSFDERFDRVNCPIELDGYFQSEKYFIKERRQIANDFKLSSEPSSMAESILKKIQSLNSICVHIRRGDYVSNIVANSYHGTCSLDYYYRGLAIVAKNLRDPHCFVFSDDPLWARENFHPNLPFSIVDIHDSNEAHEDLRLMTACQCFVIANSSLSWWGAWLGDRLEKSVVAPLRWFNASRIDTSDLIPLEWLRI